MRLLKTLKGVILPWNTSVPITQAQVSQLEAEFNSLELNWLNIIKDVKPDYRRIYYISVKNVEANQKYHEMWVSYWLPRREETLQIILAENNNLPIIPEPSEDIWIPSSWQLVEEKEKGLAVYNDKFEFVLDLFRDYENKFNHSYYLSQILAEMIEVKLTLCNINLKRGYVITTDIFNPIEYPYISEIATKVLTRREWAGMSTHRKIKCYTWILNIIFIQIYTNCNIALEVLNDIEAGFETEEAHYLVDLITSYTNLKTWSHSMLDNSLKNHLVMRKPVLMKETIVGFDTEYIAEDFSKNRMLSAQLSISGNLKLVVYLNKDYEFEGVETLSSKTYNKKGPGFFNEGRLKTWLSSQIAESRKLKYGNLDRILVKLVNILKENYKVVNFNEKYGVYNFQFAKLPVVNRFILPAEGEQLKINFETLVKIIHDSVNMEVEAKELFNEIADIDFNDIEDFIEVGSKETPPWNSKNLEQESIQIIRLSNEDNESSLELKAEDLRTLRGEKCLIVNEMNELSKLKVVLKDNIYLAAHYNSADLSMIDNWPEYTNYNVDILKKSYSSLIKPIEVIGRRVFIRDTLLLASAAAGRLEALGQMHGLQKVKLAKGFIENMDILLKVNPKLFIEYAMQDSLITLIHALFMNDFAFKLGSVNLPVTLGSLSQKYLENKWKADNYGGYQVNHKFLIGKIQETVTPQGIVALGPVGEHLNMYLGSFRGGRNESYVYGVDRSRKWFDYDLTSCYSTVMSMLGDLDYDNISSLIASDDQQENSFYNIKAKKTIEDCLEPTIEDCLESLDTIEEDCLEGTPDPAQTQSNLKNLKESLALDSSYADLTTHSTLDLLSLCGNPHYSSTIALTEVNISKVNLKNGYSALRVKFNLPDAIKYPPIPVNINENTTIYPLSGEELITGLEYLSATNILNQALKNIPWKDKNKYYIKVLDGSFIPFDNTYKPFENVINELQANRRSHPKKSALERIYKDLGNMLYGKTVCGISNNRSYDARIRLIKPMLGGNLTNPIIGAWITGFVRALLAELLNTTHKLGGTITAVTTDGFVTDIDNLEEKILAYNKDNNIVNTFLQSYRDLREKLSKDPSALEVKTKVIGIIQWATRGQISFDHLDPTLNNFKIPISAMAGFQKQWFDHKENIKMIETSLKGSNKIMYLQKRLDGALNQYKNENRFTSKNPDISMVTSLRNFRTVFDAKRIVENNEISLGGMLSTRPFRNIEECRLTKALLNSTRQTVYSDVFTTKDIYASTTAKEELLKFFIRIACGYLNFNLSLVEKINLYNICANTFGNIKREKVYLLINNILQNPGIIHGQLVPCKNNVLIVKELLNNCFNSHIFSNIKFITLFRKYFSNFQLPANTLVLHKDQIERNRIEGIIELTKLNAIKDELKRIFGKDIPIEKIPDLMKVLENFSSASPPPDTVAIPSSVSPSPSIGKETGFKLVSYKTLKPKPKNTSLDLHLRELNIFNRKTLKNNFFNK